jgi:hypothetical protein
MNFAALPGLIGLLTYTICNSTRINLSLVPVLTAGLFHRNLFGGVLYQWERLRLMAGALP